MKYTVIILFIAISFISCNRSNEDLNFGKEISLQVNIAGIIDVDSISNNIDINKIASSNRNYNNKHMMEERLIEKSYFNGEEFDAIISLVEMEKNTSKFNVKNKLALTSTMNSGIAYKAYVYKRGISSNSVGDYVGEISAVSGTSNSSSTQASSFKLVRSTEYTLIAFSWNTNITPTTSGTLNEPIFSTSSSDQELLYAKIDFDTNNLSAPPTTVNVPILFQRQNAALEIEINTMGIFAPITAIKASLATSSSQALRQGGMNLITGVFSNYEDISDRDFSFSSIGTNVYSLIANRIYTVEPTSLNTISITIDNMTLMLDNNISRSYGTQTYEVDPGFPISIERGKLQKIIVQLIANANKFTTTANSPLWGLRNLYYNPDATEEFGGFWRMRDHNSDVYGTATTVLGITEEYWNWNALISGSGISKTNTGDPCLKTYPAGTWRLPTRAEYNDLLTNANIVFQTSSDAKYMLVRQQAGVTPTAQGEFTFIKYGYRNSETSDLINSIVAYNAYNSNGSGYYWTSTESDANNAYVLEFNITGQNSGNQSIKTLNKNLGANLKCVRNNNLRIDD